jgi:hypothetical protein
MLLKKARLLDYQNTPDNLKVFFIGITEIGIYSGHMPKRYMETQYGSDRGIRGVPLSFM